MSNWFNKHKRYSTAFVVLLFFSALFADICKNCWPQFNFAKVGVSNVLSIEKNQPIQAANSSDKSLISCCYSDLKIDSKTNNDCCSTDVLMHANNAVFFVATTSWQHFDLTSIIVFAEVVFLPRHAYLQLITDSNPNLSHAKRIARNSILLI